MNASEVTGHWLIEADLYVTHGVTLQVRYRLLKNSGGKLTLLSRFKIGAGTRAVAVAATTRSINSSRFPKNGDRFLLDLPAGARGPSACQDTAEKTQHTYSKSSRALATLAFISAIRPPSPPPHPLSLMYIYVCVRSAS